MSDLRVLYGWWLIANSELRSCRRKRITHCRVWTSFHVGISRPGLLSLPGVNPWESMEVMTDSQQWVTLLSEKTSHTLSCLDKFPCGNQPAWVIVFPGGKPVENHGADQTASKRSCQWKLSTLVLHFSNPMRSQQTHLSVKLALHLWERNTSRFLTVQSGCFSLLNS